MILPLRFEKKGEGCNENKLLSMHETAPLPVKKYARYQCVLKKYKGGYKSEAVFVRFVFIRPVLFFSKRIPYLKA